MFRISIDSFVDIITNSSSVIYSRYGSSVEACYELLDEILKAVGDTTPVREVFKVTEEADIECLLDFLRDSEEELLLNKFNIDVNKEEDDSKIELILENEEIRSDLTSLYLENKDEPHTYLWIVAPEKYKNLKAKVLKFLVSPEHEASYD